MLKKFWVTDIDLGERPLPKSMMVPGEKPVAVYKESDILPVLLEARAIAQAHMNACRTFKDLAVLAGKSSDDLNKNLHTQHLQAFQFLDATKGVGG